MGPLRLTLHHFVACPCLPYFASHRWGMAVGPCLRRLAHVVAQAGCMDPPRSVSWRDTDETADTVNHVDISALVHRPYWVTKEKLQYREEEKENLVTEVLALSDKFSVKDVLSGWVRKVGSRRSSRAALQESSAVDSFVSARYIPYEQVARTINAVMRDLGKRGHSNAALQVFQWMQLQGWCRLDPHLYTTVIDTLGRSGCLDLAEKIFTDMDDSVKKDTVLYNALLHARSKAGQVEATLELFGAMKEKQCRPDLYTYNTVMHMYVKAGEGLAKVVTLFKEMCLQGIQPDVVSYDILLAACASEEYVKEAQRIFNAMEKRGVKPTVVSYTSLITAYANTGDFRAAMQVLNKMVAAKCKPNVKTFTSLINACGRGGHIEEAQAVFETMKEYGVKPNVMTYNVMIDMYTKRGEQNLAQDLFLEMVQAGLQPTGVSLTVLMSSFKAAGAYKEALTIYEQAKQLTSGCSVQTYTQALDTCVKSKNIGGMARIMEDMRVAGCSPNAVTCSVVLVALGSKCSNAKEVFQLLGSLEGFDSKLVLCCRSLLAEATRSDQEVTDLLDKLFSFISRDDVKTWTALSSSLLDALWALGWYRRAALVLAWICKSCVYDEFCHLAPDEWKLDVRRLSSGGALVAFYQWLAHLLPVARQVDLMTYDALEEGSSTSDSTKETPSIPVIKKEPVADEPAMQVEVIVPFLPSHTEGVVSRPHRSRYSSGHLFDEPKAFPRLVTVVTGWGKLSKEEGSSQVKSGVEKEIAKLGVPFRASSDAGRWTAKGEALLRWLLRPETAPRLVLWDVSTGTPR